MVVMLTVDRPPTEPTSRARRSRPTAIAAAVELAVAAGVFLVYRGGRLVTSSSTSVAQHNAERVIEWERSVGAFTEQRVQAWVIDLPGAVEFLNRYYVLVHFPVTIAFLVWVFARRRQQYAQIRNWFTGVTLLALVVHVIFPLAPPRMTEGFVDTLRVFGPNIYPEDTSKSVANQFAAMPSLHFGWALMVAVGLARLTRRRMIWMLHPAITLLAIVATGNHYWIDAAVAGVIAAVVGAVVLRRTTTAPDVSPDDVPLTPCRHTGEVELHWPAPASRPWEAGHVFARHDAARPTAVNQSGRCDELALVGPL
jgi:hypothetical protein